MKRSAGILAYRFREEIEVFLVHPGGPFFKKKDLGVWSIPKGEYDDLEDVLHAAKREFTEETGHALEGDFVALNPVKQKSGKLVNAWAIKQEIDETIIVSNKFEMEWPPRSGKKQWFEEVDCAGWFTLPIARQKINIGQVPLIDQLQTMLNT